MVIKAGLDCMPINTGIFDLCPAKSIGYAVMEKTSYAVDKLMDAGWSGLGFWSSLWNISVKDGDGNSTHCDVLLHNTL
jgi:mannose-1-phosphate guanylyltransferase